MAHEAQYLQSIVGDALARGCAATITSQPNDPVEYLARWLLRFVKNAEVEGEFFKEKQQEIESRKLALEASLRASQAEVTKQRERAAALEALATMEGDPRKLLKAAVELITKHTSAGAAYAAHVADQEEPDWSPPEDLEDVNYETEDEDDLPSVEPGAEESGTVAAEPDVAEPEASATEARPEQTEATAAAKLMDYSKKYLSYVVASSGQDFVPNCELRRPAPPPEDPEEGPTPAPVPMTFRILDDCQPLLYVPNVAFDPAATFLRSFPKIGSYIAAAIRVSGDLAGCTAGGEPHLCSVVAADTLFPEGHGQELSKEEQDFVWEVSLAASRACEASLRKAAALRAELGGAGAEQLEALKMQIGEIVAEHHELAAALPEEPPAPEEVDPEALEAELVDDGEGEGPSPEAVVEKANAKVAKLVLALAHSRWKAEVAAAKLQEGIAVHAATVQALLVVQDNAMFAVQHTVTVPQATMHALKALLLLLGQPPAEVATWKHMQRQFTPDLFAKAVAYDATAPRNQKVWSKVRAAYRAVANPKALETELPDSALGALVLRFIKQVRKVANRANAHRTTLEAVSEREQQLQAAQAAVIAAEEAAIQAKAEQERIEAEVAIAAAAAAEAGEEGIGADEEEAEE